MGMTGAERQAKHAARKEIWREGLIAILKARTIVEAKAIAERALNPPGLEPLSPGRKKRVPVSKRETARGRFVRIGNELMIDTLTKIASLRELFADGYQFAEPDLVLMEHAMTAEIGKVGIAGRAFLAEG
jgi:hypothetical protein